MSRSIGAALKAVIKNDGTKPWAGRIFRDEAPKTKQPLKWPYITWLDDVGDAPMMIGDQRVLARRRLIQIDLWQKAKDEDESVVRTLVSLIDGVRLSTNGAENTMRARVENVVRVPEPENGVVHHALDVTVPNLP